MREDIFKSNFRSSDPEEGKTKHELLNMKAEIAARGDWKILKELWLKAITGKDARMFGIEEKDLRGYGGMNGTEWQAAFSESSNNFTVVCKKGSEAIGMGMATKKKDDSWHLAWEYVREDSRGLGMQKKIMAKSLQEVIKRGGTKATLNVNIDNEHSLNNCLFFEFSIVKTNSGKLADGGEQKSCRMKADLTNPEVIRKMEEVLETQSTP